MMIYMLALAMTVAMLIATLLSLHQESQRIRVRSNDKRLGDKRISGFNARTDHF